MRLMLLVLSFFPALAAACGGSDDPGMPGGSGGSDGSSSSSSSGGPVPASPDGAYAVTMTQDDPTACQIAGHVDSVGVIDAQTKTTTVTDGVGGVGVSCTVAGSGTFGVHGTIDDGSGNHFEMIIPNIGPSASEGAPASGSLSIVSAKTAGQPYSGMCGFYFTPSTLETVAAGKVWVTFTCPGVSAGASTCPVQIGYAIFENCLAQASP